MTTEYMPTPETLEFWGATHEGTYYISREEEDHPIYTALAHGNDLPTEYLTFDEVLSFFEAFTDEKPPLDDQYDWRQEATQDYWRMTMGRAGW